MTTLTKQDVKALRNADTIVFFHNVEHAGERGSWVKAIQDADKSSTGYEQEHWFPLQTSIHNYEGGMGQEVGDYPTKGMQAEDIVASVVLLSVKVRFEIKTWLKVLRDGDEMAVTFLAGNNSEVLNKIGLSKDEAWLTIGRRSPVTGDQHALGKYFLDDVTVPVYSTARMVRPALARY